jgi:LysR family glycine cleavage system transcriptional activator
LSLTEAGAGLFPVVRDGLDAIADAIAAVKHDRDRQPLRVTTTNAFASRWLVPRLDQWSKMRPDVPLELIGTDSVLDLDAGDADVAIRYAHEAPRDCVAMELFRDEFWPVCTPSILASGGGIRRAVDLRGHVLIHSYWTPSDTAAPTWHRWLQAAGKRWRNIPQFGEFGHLSFREEAHAIEAVIAGQGIGICSDVLVARELRSGTLVKAFDLRLPGYGFYLVQMPSHPRAKALEAFTSWLQSMTSDEQPAKD